MLATQSPDMFLSITCFFNNSYCTVRLQCQIYISELNPKYTHTFQLLHWSFIHPLRPFHISFLPMLRVLLFHTSYSPFQDLLRPPMSLFILFAIPGFATPSHVSINLIRHSRICYALPCLYSSYSPFQDLLRPPMSLFIVFAIPGCATPSHVSINRIRHSRMCYALPCLYSSTLLMFPLVLIVSPFYRRALSHSLLLISFHHFINFLPTDFLYFDVFTCISATSALCCEVTDSDDSTLQF